MCFSSIAVILHAYFYNGLQIWDFEKEVYFLSIFMALIATVIPSFLISGGIKLIGSDNASIIGSIGPVSTIILANIFLDEVISFSQIIGTCFVLAGVLMITLKKKPQKRGILTA